MSEIVELCEQGLKESERKCNQLEFCSLEIYHRINTAIDVNSAMLGLQSRYGNKKKCFEILSDTQDRMKCLFHIVNIFYQSKDLKKFEVENQIKYLAKYLVDSHGVKDKIELIFHIEKISLNIDHVIPFMYLITELVTNSIKHAFPGDRKGEIEISLCPKDEKMIELKICDNGVGIPSDLDFTDYGIPSNLDFQEQIIMSNLDLEEIDSFGLFIVRMLVFQLGGKIHLDRSKGTDFKIIFNNKLILLSS